LLALAQTQPDWAVGFADEVWWSRVALPSLSAFTPADQPLRLVEQRVPPGDPDPKALACYGIYFRRRDQAEWPQDELWLRFVDKRPLSALSETFLHWICQQLVARGKRVLVLFWDNASWHVSKRVRSWIRDHNRFVKLRGKGIRIILCLLPIKSPWLNPIEPKWVHGKRAIVEPATLLSADQIRQRVCAYYHCEVLPPLSFPPYVT
jgi:DDE superfamily endonuclease